MNGNISQILVINSSMKHNKNTSTKLINKNISGILIINSCMETSWILVINSWMETYHEY